MKCPHCGGQMGIEDKFCTHCGARNTQAHQHQEEMEHYQKAFHATRRSVLEKTSFLRKHGSWLVLLTIMLALLLVAIILRAKAWDIGYDIRKRHVLVQQETHIKNLEQYLEAGDYGQFLGYYDAHDVNLTDHYEYSVILDACRSYVALMEDIAILHDPDHYRFRESHRRSSCQDIARELIELYTAENNVWRDDDPALAEDKMVYVRDIRDRAARICKTYYGMSDEEIAQIADYSAVKLGEIIERGLDS